MRRGEGPRRAHHRGHQDHGGDERPGVLVVVAGTLREEEVGREHDQVRDGAEVTHDRVAVAARAEHDEDHARQRQTGVGKLARRATLAEPATGNQEDERGLERRDEGCGDDRRLVERHEREDDAGAEAHARRDRPDDHAPRQPAPREVGGGDHDRLGDPEPVEDDRRRVGVDPLDQEGPAAPHDDGERRAGQGETDLAASLAISLGGCALRPSRQVVVPWACGDHVSVTDVSGLCRSFDGPRVASCSMVWYVWSVSENSLNSTTLPSRIRSAIT